MDDVFQQATYKVLRVNTFSTLEAVDASTEPTRHRTRQSGHSQEQAKKTSEKREVTSWVKQSSQKSSGKHRRCSFPNVWSHSVCAMTKKWWMSVEIRCGCGAVENLTRSRTSPTPRRSRRESSLVQIVWFAQVAWGYTECKKSFKMKNNKSRGGGQGKGKRSKSDCRRKPRVRNFMDSKHSSI